MKFGIRIPSYSFPRMEPGAAARLKDYCRKVEELKFDSIWVIDHFIPTPALYTVPWLEPMTVLSFAAAWTERVKIGTGILVLPFRHPVLLSKEIVTLNHLSRGRFIFGVGSGWDPQEFDIMGVRLADRGARTDEVLAAVRRLLSEERVSFEGRFFKFKDCSIEPRPNTPVPLWVAGGSLTHAQGSPDKPYIARSVLKRIASADAWVGRSSGSDRDAVKKDWEAVKRYLKEIGRDPATLIFAHTQFLHIVDSSDHEEALRLQHPFFERIMGASRSLDDLEASYLMGTVEEMVHHEDSPRMVARIQDLGRAGLQYLLLNPLTDEISQLEQIAYRVAHRFRQN